MEKAYTLVERDEVATWVKLGFAKEGNIPGFYKRSDAFLLGCSVDAALAREPREIPMQSEGRGSRSVGASRTRSRFRRRSSRTTSPPRKWTTAPIVFAEKTLAHAKKQAKDSPTSRCPPRRSRSLREAESKKAVEKALKRAGAHGVRAVRARRRAALLHGHVPARQEPGLRAGRFDRVAGVLRQRIPRASDRAPERSREAGDGVGAPRASAKAPRRGRRELLLARAERRRGPLVRVRCERLPSDGAPVRTTWSSAAERKDAIMWSRKLANPATSKRTFSSTIFAFRSERQRPVRVPFASLSRSLPELSGGVC